MLAARPPQSWKPAEREAWEKIPEPARQAIIRREREATKALQDGAEHRKVADGLRAAIAPHEARLKASNRDVLRDLPGMLQFDAVLHGGTPEAKAQMLGAIIRGAGLASEEGIAILARHLDGGQQAAPQGAPQEFRDPRFDALLAQIEQAKAERDSREREEFSQNHEFYYDVSDLMDVIQSKGLAKTREDAYKQACWANPEIRAIIQQREAAETAKAKQASTQSALAAASSIRSEPTAAVVAAGGSDDIRADLLAVAGRVGR